MATLTESTTPLIGRPFDISPAADAASPLQRALVWAGILVACLAFWGLVIFAVPTMLGLV